MRVRQWMVDDRRAACDGVVVMQRTPARQTEAAVTTRVCSTDRTRSAVVTLAFTCLMTRGAAEVSRDITLRPLLVPASSSSLSFPYPLLGPPPVPIILASGDSVPLYPSTSFPGPFPPYIAPHCPPLTARCRPAHRYWRVPAARRLFSQLHQPEGLLQVLVSRRIRGR